MNRSDWIFRLLALNSAEILSLLGKSALGEISEPELKALRFLLQTNEKILNLAKKSLAQELGEDSESLLSASEKSSAEIEQYRYLKRLAELLTQDLK